MKEHPILFSTEMVKAILDGRKTQTRRLLKRQPLDILPMVDPVKDGWVTLDTRNPNHGSIIKCRYGNVGDRLWVRESHTWVTLGEKDPWKDRAIDDGSFRRMPDGSPVSMCYKADGYKIPSTWRPSIHMPRWASRITLEIASIRVQRIQDISEEDAIAEGIPHYRDSEYWKMFNCKDGFSTKAKNAFMSLWNSINEKRGYGWEKNPWVWVIEFKRVK